MNFYEKKHIVVPTEIDQYNHVNNVVYVQWIQDVADLHWDRLCQNLPEFDGFWFVLNHNINYKGQAKLDDEVTIKTWVGETAGVKSVRHVEIYKENTLLVKSETTYCLIDSKNRKPKRITKEVVAILLPNK